MLTIYTLSLPANFSVTLLNLGGVAEQSFPLSIASDHLGIRLSKSASASAAEVANLFQPEAQDLEFHDALAATRSSGVAPAAFRNE